MFHIGNGKTYIMKQGAQTQKFGGMIIKFSSFYILVAYFQYIQSMINTMIIQVIRKLRFQYLKHTLSDLDVSFHSLNLSLNYSCIAQKIMIRIMAIKLNAKYLNDF